MEQPDSGGSVPAGGSVCFVGAGPGDLELITVKGLRLLEQADVIVYAGSLINADLLQFNPGAELIDSAPLCLDDIISLMVNRARAGRKVVRLHSGDPAFYGAIKEQIARLRPAGIGFSVVPGVSSLNAAAAALASELTVPGVTQTVIVTRAAGRTPVPEREDLGALAAHGATMAIFLSAGLAAQVQEKLMAHYRPETPVAVVHRVSWPDQRIIRTTVSGLTGSIKNAGIDRTAIILVGEALAQEGDESLLYARGFSHGYRAGEAPVNPEQGER
ncbi:MAG: precorrin-4 C(11)-methyltransferase [Thermoleophilia bacterium]